MSTLLFPRSHAPPSMAVDDAEKIRAYIASLQRDGETWTNTVDRFAEMIYRDRSTVWRWLNGERRVPKSVWERLPERLRDT